MTKKDYELIAYVISQRVENAKEAMKFGYTQDEVNNVFLTLRDLTDMLIIEFKNDNSRFNENKFLQACGMYYELDGVNPLSIVTHINGKPINS